MCEELWFAEERPSCRDPSYCCPDTMSQHFSFGIHKEAWSLAWSGSGCTSALSVPRFFGRNIWRWLWRRAAKLWIAALAAVAPLSHAEDRNVRNAAAANMMTDQAAQHICRICHVALSLILWRGEKSGIFMASDVPWQPWNMSRYPLDPSGI